MCVCRYVLNKYGTTLDDVEGAVEAQRRAYEAAHDEELPLGDRLAIRLAFSYLLQYSAAGRRPSAAALNSAANTVIAAYSNGVAAASATASGDSVLTDGPRGIFATTAAVAKRAGGRSAEAATVAARKGMEMLQKIPLPILSRSTDDEESAAAEANQQKQQYVLTQAEERLVQVRKLGRSAAALTGQSVTLHVAVVLVLYGCFMEAVELGLLACGGVSLPVLLSYAVPMSSLPCAFASND